MRCKIWHGDLFASHSEVFAHGVNTWGVMGAGIAVQFKHLAPNAFEVYQRNCASNPAHNLQGTCILYRESEQPEMWIGHLFTQSGSKLVLSYLESALENLRDQMKQHGLTLLGMPAIGCGIARVPGYDLNVFKDEVDYVFKDTNIEPLICLR